MLSNACAQLGAFGCGAYPGAVSSQACTAPLEPASLEEALALQSQWPPSRHDCCDASAVAFLAHASCDVPRSVLRSSVRCLARFGSSLFGFLRVFSLAGSFSLRQACSCSSCIGLSLFAR